jgi:signal transduction histidine kinase
VLVVALALAAAATAFVVLLQRTLIATVQEAATAQASEVAGQLRREGIDPVRTALQRVGRGQLVQVVDGRGRVVAASGREAAERTLTDVRAPEGVVRQVRTGSLPLLDDDDPYLVVVAGTRWQQAPYTVVVATPIAAEQRSVRTALSLLVLGLPILLLLVGVTTLLLVGRALAPVERIRAQVAKIGASRVDERIPVPETGDEIARLAETMNDMLARLQEGQQRQRRFVADASHELRSPLTTLGASLEVAAADPSGAAWGDLSPLMMAEVDRMRRLVQDLLLLATVDEHTMRLNLEDVDLDDLVEEGERRLRARPELVVESHAVPTRVVGDRGRLARVVTNLTDNAAQHARRAVRVTLSGDNSGAVLVVEDDGPGVPVAERERVFERFVRLDDSRERRSGGSGLGLAIVREVVLAHGGTVELGDTGSGGCRVEVRLPAVASPPPARVRQPPSSAIR